MAITLADVEKIAQLAKLEFSDEEQQLFTQHLHQIVSYMEQLNTVNTETITATAHILPLKNALRLDEVQPGLTQTEALANAPVARNGFFCVPKVIHFDRENTER
ncbi:Asp-tRNA(Asn)/Glu-tRNA(Gln) amidotransferase subunit GatC [candidate division KSB1 bacterium]|nr:Asp-tRNA(Asn)/Glu-tRNA(Gln) amidotransferase subunit GatC [candidate division KSB1 bacterium]